MFILSYFVKKNDLNLCYTDSASAGRDAVKNLQNCTLCWHFGSTVWSWTIMTLWSWTINYLEEYSRLNMLHAGPYFKSILLKDHGPGP